MLFSSVSRCRAVARGAGMLAALALAAPWSAANAQDAPLQLRWVHTLSPAPVGRNSPARTVVTASADALDTATPWPQ
ncbi:MAG: hypothetical protein EOP38_29360, partial [Rubrivivax sp.]